ncbi:protein enabled [Sesbania bispinosa]|nr:protein enabled [Sesbania bispinosa]
MCLTIEWNLERSDASKPGDSKRKRGGMSLEVNSGGNAKGKRIAQQHRYRALTSLGVGKSTKGSVLLGQANYFFCFKPGDMVRDFSKKKKTKV